MASKPIVHRIYMDACCFIDLAKNTLGICPPERHDELFFLQQLLKAAEKEKVVIYTSTLSIAECRYAGSDSKDDVRHLFDAILLSGHIVTIVECSPFIATRARDLCIENELTLKGADSVHIATALEMNCKEFLTTDDKGPIKNHRKISKLGLAVIHANKTRYLPHEFRQLESPKLTLPKQPSDPPN